VPRRLQPLMVPARLNGTWALDFMADALYNGRGFRILNIIDEGNREVLAIEIGTSIRMTASARCRPDVSAEARCPRGVYLTGKVTESHALVSRAYSIGSWPSARLPTFAYNNK